MRIYLVEYKSVYYTDSTRTTTEVVWKSDIAFEYRRHAVRYRKQCKRDGAKPMRIKRWSRRALNRHNENHINQISLVERYESEEY